MAMLDDAAITRLALSPLRQRLLADAGTRQRRGFTEKYLETRSDVLIVDPMILGQNDSRGPDPDAVDKQDRFAAGHLVRTAAGIVRDVSRMRAAAEAEGSRLLTFTIEADVAFARPADIESFTARLADAVAALAPWAGSCGGKPRRDGSVEIGGRVDVECETRAIDDPRAGSGRAMGGQAVGTEGEGERPAAADRDGVGPGAEPVRGDGDTALACRRQQRRDVVGTEQGKVGMDDEQIAGAQCLAERRQFSIEAEAAVPLPDAESGGRRGRRQDQHVADVRMRRQLTRDMSEQAIREAITLGLGQALGQAGLARSGLLERDDRGPVHHLRQDAASASAAPATRARSSSVVISVSANACAIGTSASRSRSSTSSASITPS